MHKRMDGASRPASLPILATFGEALRYARRAARLTQSDLGIAVGYSREQIVERSGELVWEGDVQVF